MKKNKKKAPKRKAPAPARKDNRGVMAIIPYSEIAKPEVYKGKFTLIPTPFNELQIRAIVGPTPPQIIKKRPGKGGGTWDYVPGWWFKKKLNFVFGFSHDFEILGERIDGDFITVKGKLTVKNPKTGTVIASKTDYGGAAIKYLRGTKNYLDISNDFKAAATDSFKRCAVQFGFAMDVYGKGESVDEGYQVTNGSETPPEAPQRATDDDTEAYLVFIQYLNDNGVATGKEEAFVEAKLGRKINWKGITKKDIALIKAQLMSKLVKR